MSEHYVLVQGSYDATYFGPFEDKNAAEAWKTKSAKVNSNFDYHVHTLAEMKENMEEFGSINVYEPSCF